MARLVNWFWLGSEVTGAELSIVADSTVAGCGRNAILSPAPTMNSLLELVEAMGTVLELIRMTDRVKKASSRCHR